MYSQDEKDKMAMKNSTIEKFKKDECPDGYYWNGNDCVKKGPLHSTGAKLGVGAGIAGALGVATSMIVDARNTAKAKKQAKNEINTRDDKKYEKAKKKASKQLGKEFKGTVAPR